VKNIPLATGNRLEQLSVENLSLPHYISKHQLHCAKGVVSSAFIAEKLHNEEQ
jgi:hypothetical protein